MPGSDEKFTVASGDLPSFVKFLSAQDRKPVTSMEAMVPINGALFQFLGAEPSEGGADDMLDALDLKLRSIDIATLVRARTGLQEVISASNENTSPRPFPAEPVSMMLNQAILNQIRNRDRQHHGQAGALTREPLPTPMLDLFNSYVEKHVAKMNARALKLFSDDPVRWECETRILYINGDQVSRRPRLSLFISSKDGPDIAQGSNQHFHNLLSLLSQEDYPPQGIAVDIPSVANFILAAKTVLTSYDTATEVTKDQIICTSLIQEQIRCLADYQSKMEITSDELSEEGSASSDEKRAPFFAQCREPLLMIPTQMNDSKETGADFAFMRLVKQILNLRVLLLISSLDTRIRAPIWPPDGYRKPAGGNISPFIKLKERLESIDLSDANNHQVSDHIRFISRTTELLVNEDSKAGEINDLLRGRVGNMHPTGSLRSKAEQKPHQSDEKFSGQSFTLFQPRAPKPPNRYFLNEKAGALLGFLHQDFSEKANTPWRASRHKKRLHLINSLMDSLRVGGFKSEDAKSYSDEQLPVFVTDPVGRVSEILAQEAKLFEGGQERGDPLASNLFESFITGSDCLCPDLIKHTRTSVMSGLDALRDLVGQCNERTDKDEYIKRYESLSQTALVCAKYLACVARGETPDPIESYVFPKEMGLVESEAIRAYLIEAFKESVFSRTTEEGNFTDKERAEIDKHNSSFLSGGSHGITEAELFEINDLIKKGQSNDKGRSKKRQPPADQRSERKHGPRT